MSEERDEPGTEGEDGDLRRRILQKLAKRIQNPRQLSGDAMELVGAVLETSDRAKTEAVRLIAREVRNYLEELRLKEGLQSLLAGHSLEVRVSLQLKPLPKGDAPGVPDEGDGSDG
jgi:hypothetical protein